MADKLSEEQISEMEQAFLIMDKDNSKEISIEELEMVMKSLGLNPHENEVRDMIAEVDADNSKTIDFPEFVTMLAIRMKDTVDEDNINNVFDLFDKDRDDKILASELKDMMLNLGEKLTDEDIKDMIDEADTEGNGSVSRKDFQRLMQAPALANQQLTKKQKIKKKKTKQRTNTTSTNNDLEEEIST
ncbi:unnamed protein product [Didymodactylos carnosus]|uniref:EF-hand domain-containing protein n=1 Tax=Didymodactylos carnosus TaxID=1234261 RepID=A0A8S2KBZ2_9BILA|nr:unnamed protein product [Didymodactylos carnosus]CAF3846140.1 unnamed protein product [Didymodactylos carnosus]